MMERNDQSEQIGELAAALARAQGKLLDVPRKARNKYAGYDYATLTDCANACREVLSAEGIAICQYEPHPSEIPSGMMVIITELIHQTGQWKRGWTIMPVVRKRLKGESDAPASHDPQDYGQIMTYARRYGLCAMVFMVPEDDTDADTTRRDRDEPTPPSPEPPKPKPASAPAKPPAPTPAIPPEKAPVELTANQKAAFVIDAKEAGLIDDTDRHNFCEIMWGHASVSDMDLELYTVARAAFAASIKGGKKLSVAWAQQQHGKLVEDIYSKANSKDMTPADILAGLGYPTTTTLNDLSARELKMIKEGMK